jgi:ribulose-5-phosphate 4-epimerase/fuculose-1-phosphate aldolase
MLEALREEVCAANRLLEEYGLVRFSWGNASGIDREKA